MEKFDKSASTAIYRRYDFSYYGFIDYVENTPVSSDWEYVKASHSDREKEWDLGAGYEGSMALARDGWAEGTAMLKEAMIDAHVQDYIDGPAWHTDIVGVRPIVPAALMGVPDSMLAYTPRPQTKPVQTIDMYISVSHNTDSAVAVAHGAGIASIVDTIEMQGVSVELNAIVQSSGEYVTKQGTGVRTNNKRQTVSTAIRLKNSDQPMDLDVLSYAIIHPAFFRRQWFKWLETHNEYYSGFNSGYGGCIFTPEKPDPDNYSIPTVRSSDSPDPAVRLAQLVDNYNAYTETGESV